MCMSLGHSHRVCFFTWDCCSKTGPGVPVLPPRQQETALTVAVVTRDNGREASYLPDMPSPGNAVLFGPFNAWLTYCYCWCTGALNANFCLGKKWSPQAIAKFVPFIQVLTANWFLHLWSTHPLQSSTLHFIGKFKALWTLAVDLETFHPLKGYFSHHWSSAFWEYHILSLTVSLASQQPCAFDLENLKHTEALFQMASATLLTEDQTIRKQKKEAHFLSHSKLANSSSPPHTVILSYASHQPLSLLSLDRYTVTTVHFCVFSMLPVD